MIKLEGRVLLFDVINQLSNKIPKDCKLTMPEKVPLTWNFEHNKPIGFATPIRDDKGIYATAETLLEIGLTLAPVREEYYFKIVEEA